eukprot:CAMPEP_0204642642 /NCGR_PEP_ID=MMETSP0717-20131115/51630_1 /ASSEMBLY_ACC=CAM_ASM_000666 /TAXON_ID=230516 /ORGANISM="Chaetoceros curvisetus" /LENGTH=134 /DNA_ID=CAMNT_0051663421 /DNA_START=39 /DNA_END=443 /DNA_ORIENTATION=+
MAMNNSMKMRAAILLALLSASTIHAFSMVPKSSSSMPSINSASITTAAATATTAILSNPAIATAYETMDDVEIAELPPVWVPIVFAIGIIGGVGVLTASLGDVMNEEASLGLMSGAKAKKEKERSRSSYFKKTD